jgi:flagellar motor switch protein FliN/FliY
MSTPHEVLSQLLSPAQADSLQQVGSNGWDAAVGALAAVLGGAPTFDEPNARLVMPDEVVGEYAAPHLVVPLEVSTDNDQSALAYFILDTAAAAAALQSEADDPNDQEQQTIVVASTIIGQVLQALNAQVFSASTSGHVISMDDVAANTMPALLATLDEPALAFDGTLAAGAGIPIKLFLPGTFLDIVAGAATPARAAAAPTPPPAANEPVPFTLTAEDLDMADLIEEELLPEPEPVPAFAAAAAPAAARPGPARAPTQMAQTPAAQRARFTPLADPEPAATRSGIDLLAGLQMNVTVELGRTELTVSDVLGLGPGSVIELDRLAGEPVDIMVNDRLVARGEVVVVDENFGVRVVEVVRRAETEERVS